MAWMNTVGGKLKSDFNYSKNIVYNNFPWPESIAEQQKEKIRKTANGILEARAKYPDWSLADIYDKFTMPMEVKKAHQLNDKAVIEAYGKGWKKEEDCVADLMKMYVELTTKQ